MFLEEIRVHAKVAEVCITDRRNCADTIVGVFCSKLPACHFIWVKYCTVSKLGLFPTWPVYCHTNKIVNIKVLRKVWDKARAVQNEDLKRT